MNFSEFKEPAAKRGEKQRIPEELLFLIVLWTLIPRLVLFFIYLGLSFFRASLQIQVIVIIVGIAVISVRMFRFYMGVRVRMLAKIKAGPEVIVGAVGIVTADLKPKGEIRVNGEFWQAVAEEGWIEKDREVEGMEDLALAVKMVKEKAELARA